MTLSTAGARLEAPPMVSRTQHPLLALLIRLHLYVGLWSARSFSLLR
ncbi:MAG: hypothetical protein KJ803_17120 [Gammaproteobacteria bacterium]|nr:hypothetical protein [Gammaproteobacteria bacterium]